MLNHKDIVVSEVENAGILQRCGQEGFDYVINPYVGCPNPCKYCYASFMRRFSHHKEGWGEFIDVKNCSKTNWSKAEGKDILIGSVTECYNFFEKKYQNTRKILKNLSKIDCNVLIMTKSSLILRDVDILKTMKNVKVAVSISTLDQQLADDIEPQFSIKERLDTISKLHKAGIFTIVNISPIMPYITNPFEIMEKTLNFADQYIFESLNLRNEFKPAMINYMYGKACKEGDLFALYNKIYRQSDFSYFADLSKQLQNYCVERNINFIDKIQK